VQVGVGVAAEQVIGGAKQTGFRPVVQQALPSHVPVREPFEQRLPTWQFEGVGVGVAAEQVIGGARQTGFAPEVQQAVPSQVPVREPFEQRLPT
jgi:hypothetical protein